MQDPKLGKSLTRAIENLRVYPDPPLPIGIKSFYASLDNGLLDLDHFIVAIRRDIKTKEGTI